MGTDSNAIKLHELLQETSIYQMPLFQRRYQWTVDAELQKFWEDLTSVVDDEVDLSFLGAIVLQVEKAGSAKNSRIYTVIDGQQRITTFFLLLCAACDFASKNGFPDYAQDLERQYLGSKLAAETGKAKLTPTFRDNSNFNAVIKYMDGVSINLLPDTGKSDGPMILAFMYFSEMIEKFVDGYLGDSQRDRLEKLVDAALERMEIVQIILDKSHNANEVFDRLNTSGRPLTTIDLVRNELFQTVSEDYDKAHKLYSSLWEPFEKSFDNSLSDLDSETRGKIVDGYFFPYALVHMSSAKKNNLLKDLRKIWQEMCSPDGLQPKLSPEIVISSLEEFRGPYLALDQGIRMDGLSDSLWDSISALRCVPIPGVTHPYLMKLLCSVAAGKTSEEAACDICAVLESFFVRRGFVGLEPTGLHSIFKRLWLDAGANAAEVASKIETGTISFPNDKDVMAAIVEKGLYKKKIEKFVLWAYEIGLQKNSYVKLSYLPDITADHVMPRSWQGDWKNIISEEDHSLVRDLWGNLVPLSKPENSAKGAKSYGEAKEMLQHETAFSTTKRFLAENSIWDKEAIIARSAELAKWAVERWPKPTKSNVLL